MVVQGVIKPPPEIRAVADRTALYVAKNGRAFESRILNSEKGKTPKFAFLHSTSPFHAYYEDRVKFYEEGGTDEKEAEEKATEDAKKQAEAKGEEEKQEATADNTTTNNKRESKHRASAIDPIAKALLEQRAKILRHRAAAANEKQGDAKETTEEDDEESAALSALLPPPELRFINIVAPASLSIADVETIQLVAQFTALDGKNGSFLSQFIHREWNNPRFAFAQPRHGHFAYFSSLVDAYRTILSDWTMSGTSAANDYIKKLSNNPDKCLETAAYWAEYKRDREERSNSEEDGQTVAVIDWHDFVIVETIDFAPHEIVDVVPPPPPPMLPLQPLSTVTDEDMDVSDEEEDEPIRVVPAYEHKMATQNKSTIMMIDPITGKSVSVEDMPEHMRIQLLDPKWAEERKKFQDKQKDSNLVSGDAVADNLARFTQAIGDSRVRLTRVLYYLKAVLYVFAVSTAVANMVTILFYFILLHRMNS
jgi:splicing factor 3A subunit 1